MKILEMLDNLKAVSKRKDKEALLEEYLADSIFRNVVISALDPRKMYWIKDLPESYDDEEELGLYLVLDNLLPKLINRELTGNAAIDAVSMALGSLNDDDAEVLKRVLLKDLKCGVGLKTVNKVWGSELIYDHPYMRYQSFNDKNLKRVSYPAYIQTKIDGLYLDVIFLKGQGPKDGLVFMTRNGNVLEVPESVKEHIYYQMEAIGYGDVVFQGEGVIVGEDGKDTKRQDSNGIFYSLEGLEENKDSIMLRFWDIIPYSDFVKKKCDTPYENRMEYLFDLKESGCPYCEVVETKVVESEEEAYDVYGKWISEGFEGAVLKNFDLKWKDGTAPTGVKMKPVREADLVVVGWNPGKGKYSQGIGSLTCESSEGLVQVNVAGLSDAQRGVESVKCLGGNITGYRAVIDFDKDQYNGSIIPVSYNELIENELKPGLYSLFLPRVKTVNGEIEFRKDKTEADSYEDIKEKEKGG